MSLRVVAVVTDELDRSWRRNDELAKTVTVLLLEQLKKNTTKVLFKVQMGIWGPSKASSLSGTSIFLRQND